RVAGCVAIHEGGGAREGAACPVVDRGVPDESVEGARNGRGGRGRSLGIEAEMAEVSGASQVSAQEPALEEDRAAHSRSEREEHRVRAADRGALPGLAEERGLRVVEHADRGRGRKEL